MAESEEGHLRVRGGARYDVGHGWRAFIHMWLSEEGLGDPDHAFETDDAWPTEDQALSYYRRKLRPAVREIQTNVEAQGLRTVRHR